MTKIVNIRNVPEDLYGILKRRAGQAGMSLPEYVLNELKRAMDHEDSMELFERQNLKMTTRKSS